MPENVNNFLAQLGSNPGVQAAEEAARTFYFSNLALLKFVSFIVSGSLIAFAVYSMVRTGWLALRVDRVQDVFLQRNIPKRHSIRAWRNVKRTFYSGDDNSLKVALIDADNILDEALKISGVRGDSLGERLKELSVTQMPNLDLVWEAHKLRNRLVHDISFVLDRKTAEKALAIYQQTFEELGLIDSGIE